MAVSQVHVLIKDNVDLNIKLVSCMVSLQALDLFDGLGESHSEIEQYVSFVSSCCSSREIPYMASRSVGPVKDNKE